MASTKYEDDVFELTILSAVQVNLLPHDPINRYANDFVALLDRLHTEADVLHLKAEDIAPGHVRVDVEHSNGAYADEGVVVDGVATLTWPNPIGDPYSIAHLAALMAIRVELTASLQHFHPTLVEVQFL